MAAGDIALSIIIGAQDNASGVIAGISVALGQLASGNVLGAVAVGAAAVGAAMAGAAKDAGNYQQSLNQLVTSAGESQANLKAVGDGILQISTDTGTSADQLTKAMYYIESSGQHGADGLNVLKVAAEGAKSENADLATVAKALTTVMTDYHLPVTDSAAAMNGLIATVQNGKTNLQDLSSSMGAVLPVASSMGISFPQVAGAMATMTNAGMTARNAAQNLAHVLVALESPSGVATKAMQSVGLSAQQVKDALVSQGLPAALQLIEDHVGKKFPAGSVESETALKNIMGGLVGLKTAAMLTGDSLGTTEDNIKKITAAMNDGSGAVLGWDLVQTSFNFKLDQAKAAFSAMMITLGTELLPVFGKVVDWVTQAVTGFTQWEEKTHAVEGALNVVVTAIGWVVDGLGKLGDIVGQVISAIAPSFDDLAKSATTWGQNFANNFADGVSAVVGDIISVVEQIGVAIEDYLGFASPTRKGPGSRAHLWGPALVRTLANGMVASVSMVDTAANTVASRLAAVQGGQGTGQTISKGLTASGSAGNATNTLANGLKSGAGAVGSAVAAVGAQLSTLCSTHAKAASTCASTTLTHHLAATTKANAHVVKAAADHVGSQTSGVGTHATTHAATAHKALTTGLASKIKSSAPAVAGAVADLSNMIKQPLDNIPKAVSDAANKVKTAAQPLGAVAQWVKQAWGDLGSFFKGVGQAMLPGLLSIWNIIQAQLIPSFKGLWTAASPLVDLYKQLAIGAGEIVLSFGKWLTIGGGLKSMWDGLVVAIRVVISIFSTLNSIIAATIGPIFKQLHDTVLTQLVPAFSTLWQAIVPLLPMLKQIAEGIGAVFLVALGIWIAGISAILQALAGFLAGVIKAVGGIIEAFAGLITFFAGFTAFMDDLFHGRWGKLVGDLKTMWNGVVLMFKGVWDTATGLFDAGTGVIKGLVFGFYTTLLTYFNNLYQGITGGKNAWDTLTDIVNNAVDSIKKAWQNMVSWVQSAAQSSWDTLKKGIADVTGWIGQQWNNAVNTVVGWFSWLYNHNYYFKDLADSIKKNTDTITLGLQTAWSTTVKWVGDRWNDMVNLATTAWNNIAKLFSNAWTNYISRPLTDIFNRLSTWWNDEVKQSQKNTDAMWKAIQTIFANAWNTYISTPMANLLGFLGKWFTDRGNDFKTWGGNLLKMFGDGITAGFHWVLDAITNLGKQIYGLLGFHSPPSAGPLATSDQWMPNMMTMFGNSITTNTPKVLTPITNLAASISTTMNGIATLVQKGIAGAQTGANSAQQSANAANASASAANISATTAQNSAQTAQQQVAKAIQAQQQATQAARESGISSTVSQQSASSAQQSSDAAQGSAIGATDFGNAAQDTATAAQQSATAAQSAAQGSADFGTAAANASQSASTAASASASASKNASIMSDAALQAASGAYTHAISAGKSWSDAKSAAEQAATQVKRAEASQESVSESYDTAKTQANMVQGLVGQVSGYLGQIGGMAAQAADQGASMIAGAQAAAAQAAAVLAIHSPAKEGPLSDSDTWMPNLMKMFMEGLEANAPLLKNATTIAATGVKQAFAQAATDAGLILTSLKQKRDDIYATLSSSTGVAGIAAKYLTTTSDIAGDIPISYQIAPGTSGTQTTQNMTIHLDLDGRTIGKVVTKYQEGELRAQGNIRSK